MYKFYSLGGQNYAFRLGFGPPKFPGTKSGWFGAFFEKRSILVIFDLRHPTTFSLYVNFDPYTPKY